MLGLSRFDPSLEKFTNYPVTLMYSVLADGDIIWAGTSGFGLAKFDPEQEIFTFYSNEPGTDYGITDNTILSLFKDRQEQLWVGTFAGGACRFDIDQEKFTCFTHDPNNPDSLSNNTVLDIYGTSEGNIWIATSDGLNKFNQTSQTFVTYREQDGLPNNMVYAILPDPAGNLWLSTNKGLSRFNLKNETFTNFSTYDGLQSNEFNQGAKLLNQDGELFFGGINGFNRFFAADIVENAYQSPVVITHFNLFNEPVKVGIDAHLPESLQYTPKISLSYEEKFFSFDFASLHYADPERIQYAFQLVGLDEDWIFSGNRHYASYTNVPPGKYSFQVKATNCDGVWNQQIAAIEIEIIPPFWQALWFKILMVGLGSAFVLGVFELRLSMVRKQKEKLEEQVVERTRALNETMVELTRSKDAAEVANRAKSTFLANISHELRTPLNAILGFSQLLINTSKSPSETEKLITGENLESVEIIHESGIHLLALINDVLEMSKIEAGRMILRETSFDLFSLLKGLEDMFRLRAEEKNLTLSFEIQEGVPQYIYADEGKLRQILLNLLGNAVKFTDRGSIILGVMVRDEPGWNGAELKPGNMVLQFDVSDTGPGIAPEDMELIFKPFSQATSVENSEGTGLGLSISKEYANLLGGDVSATSQPGQGSTFSLILPIIESNQTDEDSKIKSRRLVSGVKSEHPIRVLIVDDKAENRKLLIKILAPLKFEIRDAENGKTALEIWQDWSPNIILMDMRMPVMDGYEATRQIKATTKGQATVIIAVTASALEEDREMILSEGCDAYIRKPFRDHEIYNEFEKHLGIQILYEEVPLETHKIKSESSSFDYCSELSRLPSSQVNSLHKALSTGDITQIHQLLDEIDKQSPQLKLRLKDLVEHYKFDQIIKELDAITGVRKEVTKRG